MELRKRRRKRRKLGPGSIRSQMMMKMPLLRNPLINSKMWKDPLKLTINVAR